MDKHSYNFFRRQDMIYKVFFYLKQTEVRQGAQDTNSFRLQKNSECSNELVMNDTNI